MSRQQAESGDSPGEAAPVSVVVPCFRCRDSITHAVASVAAQSLLPAEVILVDDASGDGTADALAEVAASYRVGWVKVVSLPKNSGPSTARNTGWRHATQPYVAFLDADDSWHPEKLRLQWRFLREDPEIVLIGHSMNVQHPSSAPPAVRGDVRAREVSKRELLIHNPFPTASVIVRRDVAFRFDESRRRVEDYLLWAQLVLSGTKCVKLNQVLASWHKRPYGAGGLSGDLDAMYSAGGDVRRELHASGLLSLGELRFAQIAAGVKHVRRVVLSRVRRGLKGRAPWASGRPR